jgi:hypothetical protein
LRCRATRAGVVSEPDGEGDEEAGRFCTYGRLAAHIEREGLAAETTCRVDL